MNPKRQQKMEQSLTEIREMTPGLWWALYSGCLDRGFTRDQTLELVKCQIFAQAGCPVLLSSRPADDSPEGSES